MKDKNLKKFRDNFYKFSTFYAGNDQDFLSLKQSWVINKIVSKRKSWNINSLTRFIESLPHEYDFFEGDFFKFCLLALKGKFIKSSFLQIQDNARIEMHTGRDTQNSSSNLWQQHKSKPRMGSSRTTRTLIIRLSIHSR